VLFLVLVDSLVNSFVNESSALTCRGASLKFGPFLERQTLVFAALGRA
jgi:hypothetical protein